MINLSAVHPGTRAIDAQKIRGITVSEATVANNQVLAYNSENNQYEPVNLEGKILTSSDTTPTGGVNGSHHINLSTGDILKNISDTWTVVYTIGQGSGGSSLLFGNGLPSIEIGSLGDSYIDTVNGTAYKKETVESVTTWVSKYTFSSGAGLTEEQTAILAGVPVNLSQLVVRSADAASGLPFAKDGALVQAYLKDIGTIDANAIVVLNFEDEDILSITDSATTPNTITYHPRGAAGTAMSLESGGKFGSKALYLPGTLNVLYSDDTDYIIVDRADGGYLPCNGGDATIEFWFKGDSDMIVANVAKHLYAYQTSDYHSNGIVTYDDGYRNGARTGFQIIHNGWTEGFGYTVNEDRIALRAKMVDGNWHHFAHTCKRYAPYEIIPAQDDIPTNAGSSIDSSSKNISKIYIDGVKIPGWGVTAYDGNAPSARLWIPYPPSCFTDATLFKGRLDGIRASNIIRYNGNFTPSEEPFAITQIKDYRLGSKTIPMLEERMIDETKKASVMTTANNGEIPMFKSGMGGIDDATLFCFQVDATGSVPVVKDYSNYNRTMVATGAGISYSKINDWSGYSIDMTGVATASVYTANRAGFPIETWVGDNATAATKHSFEFRFKSNKSSGIQYIVSIGDTFTGYYGEGFRTNNGILQYMAGWNDWSYDTKNLGTQNVCDGNWHHARVSWDYSEADYYQKINFFLDGIKVLSFTAEYRLYLGGGNIRIGRLTSENFNGSIAGIRWTLKTFERVNFAPIEEDFTLDSTMGKYLTTELATLADIDASDPYKPTPARAVKEVIDRLGVPATISQQIIQDLAANFDQPTDAGKIVAITGTMPQGNDSKTKILLHLDSNAFIDSSVTNATPTYVEAEWGNSTVYTASGKFTGGLTVGTADMGYNYISYPNTDKRYDRRGDWCLDFQFKMQYPPNYYSGHSYPTLLFGCGSSSANWRVNVSGDMNWETYEQNSSRLSFVCGGIAVNAELFGIKNIYDNAFHHLMLTVKSNVWQWWIDGVAYGDPVTSATLTDVSGRLLFGGHDQFYGSGMGYTFTLDEFRISSTYRKDTAFTAPTVIYAGGNQDFHVSPLSYTKSTDALALNYENDNGTIETFSVGGSSEAASIIVDGTTITGDGTTENPLVSHSSVTGLTEIIVDGTTITGAGTVESPLVSHSSGGDSAGFNPNQAIFLR